MYTMQQAEQLAADFLRQQKSDLEVALIDNERSKSEKGEFFYFKYQSVKYLATKDSKYALYGPPAVAVHSKTGESRWVGMQEFREVNPFNN